MVQLSSDTVEHKLLSFLFVAPYHIRIVSLGDGIYSRQKHRDLFTLAKQYIEKYKQPPAIVTLIDFTKSQVTETKQLDRFSEALLLLDDLPAVEPKEFDFYAEKAVNYMAGRGLFDAAERIKQEFEQHDELDCVKLRQEVLRELLLDSSKGRQGVQRGFVYETVKQRAQEYKQRAKGEKDPNLVPTGIRALDEVLGGMIKSFVTLIYSRTAGGKSRTAINIAINQAIEQLNVIYISLEMKEDLLAACIDSRLGWIDSNQIIFGKLDKKSRRRYLAALKKQYRNKLGIYIVDIPAGASALQIWDEIELYKSTTGLIPDSVIIDYANLAEPTKAYNGRSEKYDFLFKEIHELARAQHVALLTMVQEKRKDKEKGKSSNKKPQSDEDEGNLDDIGLSHYIATHCEIVIHLLQNKFDEMQNRLRAKIEKYRYGKKDVVVPLTAIFDRGYVGDRLVPGTKGYVGNKLTPSTKGVKLTKDY